MSWSYLGDCISEANVLVQSTLPTALQPLRDILHKASNDDNGYIPSNAGDFKRLDVTTLGSSDWCSHSHLYDFMALSIPSVSSDATKVYGHVFAMSGDSKDACTNPDTSYITAATGTPTTTSTYNAYWVSNQKYVTSDNGQGLCGYYVEYANTGADDSDLYIFSDNAVANAAYAFTLLGAAALFTL